MDQNFSLDLAGKTLKFETGLLANQSHGSVMVSLGDTVVFSSITMGAGREGQNFLPLTVEFEERHYAAGKIKGSRFIKRESKPSEKAVLTSRLIDRPIRPLINKKITNELQLICSVLSADMEHDPATTGLIAASTALMISGIPFEGPVAGVRIGMVNENGEEKLIVNPTYSQVEAGKLDLVVAGTESAITMVEASAKEVSEEVMLKALEIAHVEIKKICALQIEFAKVHGKKLREVSLSGSNDDAKNVVKEVLSKEVLDAVTGVTKQEVKDKIHDLEVMLAEKFSKEIEEGKFGKAQLNDALLYLLEQNMRKNILEEGKRLDGRSVDEIRPIMIKTGLLPRTHGSALFQRGETQALSITTLGAPGDAQVVDSMDEEGVKRYMHHYNFPPYSVGEVKPLRGPSRRDIGHGNLAERALLPVLPEVSEFPYTIWVVSEIFSCNGSSSMASVCGSSLSLMSAGVPIKKPVAGIAMGLVTYDGDVGNGYKILTDIQGMEDFAGDMDFKVAGTKDGINALQMDIKVKGLTLDLLAEAMSKAKTARSFILDEMEKAVPKVSSELSPFAPRILSLQIDPEKIRDVIGKGGETIQKITKETGSKIDIEQSGLVMITSNDAEKARVALEWVKKLTYEPSVGDVIEGKIVRIAEFGAFVEIAPGKDGLLHISEISRERIAKVSDVLKEGQVVKVKVVGVEMGKYKLSMKALM